jgi:hypothetical protein
MEWIKDWWSIVVSIIIFIIWLVRLEMKQKSLCKEFNSHKETCKLLKEQEEKLMDKTFERIEKSIDKIFDLVSDVQKIVSRLEEWKDAQRERKSG